MPALKTLTAVALALCLAAPAEAAQKGSGSSQASARGKKKGKRKVFSGSQVPVGQLRQEPLPQPSGKLHVYSVNLREEVTVDLYRPDGSMSEESLEALNHLWRCRKTRTEKPINPNLFELLSLIQDHFDGRRIELLSGFRNQPRQTSYHFHGSASDIRIEGVSPKALREFISTLDVGHMGLGLYPRSGFIHVDVREVPSYRWIDYSGPGSTDPYKQPRSRPRSS